MRRVLQVIGALVILAIAAALVFFFWPEGEVTVAASPSLPKGPALVARGEYVAREADCFACHSPPGRPPFSGGLAFKLPFGTIYSSNITPDKETGIGTWSDADFVRALHRGVGKDGSMLYPAFPYASYALMTDDDALAIKAYLFSLKPVHAAVPPAQLGWPYSWRFLMRAWRFLYVPGHRFEPASDSPAALNRGAYLVEAMGHCGECHTPRTWLYGLKRERWLAGAETQGWRAYNITSDKAAGIGAWSDQDIADYLATGYANDHGVASGNMADAVNDSLSYLQPDDIRSIVTYLRTVPAKASDEPPVAMDPPAVKASAPDLPPPAEVKANTLGLQVFESACASCHAWDGTGQEHSDASLLGDRSVNDPRGTNLIQVLLNGAHLIHGEQASFMPAFGAGYSDVELAAVGNYVIAHFGDEHGAITPTDVAAARNPK